MVDYSQYKSYVEDEEEGLYSENGVGGGQNDLNWDCDMNGVFEIVSIQDGRSDNKNHKGRPYFICRLKVVEILSQAVPEVCEHVQSAITEGSVVAQFNWLPRNIEYGTSAEEDIHLDQIIDLATSAMKLKVGHFDIAQMNKLTENDGERMSGMKLGAKVEHTVRDKDGAVFFTPDFYPVDEQHNRIEKMTPDQVRQFRNGN
jgi:hypothetical protein